MTKKNKRCPTCNKLIWSDSYACRKHQVNNGQFKLGKRSLRLRRKLSEANKRYFKTHPEAIEKNRQWHLGRKMSEETKKKKSATMQGIKLEEWKGFTSPKYKIIRKSTDYILWRTAVFMRDDYTCQNCYIKGGTLHADHIKPFAQYPELRFAIDNGRTLCVSCHMKTETWGRRAHEA